MFWGWEVDIGDYPIFYGFFETLLFAIFDRIAPHTFEPIATWVSEFLKGRWNKLLR